MLKKIFFNEYKILEFFFKFDIIFIINFIFLNINLIYIIILINF